METVLLEKRELLGKKSKNLLKDGFIPAVIYNAKGDSTNVKVDASVAKKIVKIATSTTIFDIKLGEKACKALIKDVDLDPVTEDIRHIAFFEIDENKEMVFSIPFELTGISPAVKNNIGILVKVLPALEVRCKLADLKPSIVIDISKLEHPGQIIEVHDIKLPDGISLINKEMEQATIVTITEIQKEEEVAPATTTEGAETPAEEGAASQETAEEPKKE